MRCHPCLMKVRRAWRSWVKMQELVHWGCMLDNALVPGLLHAHRSGQRRDGVATAADKNIQSPSAIHR